MLCGMADAFYDPALYEALHRGNPGDIAFYVEACADGQEVLETGTNPQTERIAANRLLLQVPLHDGVLEHAVARRADGMEYGFPPAHMSALQAMTLFLETRIWFSWKTYLLVRPGPLVWEHQREPRR